MNISKHGTTKIKNEVLYMCLANLMDKILHLSPESDAFNGFLFTYCL
jgi:hypothetical protein